tara:strand:- start:1293 stop:1787 length:495 start_codon:yes stop_codon:yes gene_type:complete
MTTEPTQEQTPPNVANETLEQATDTIKALFSTLVAMDRVEITDIFGDKYDVSTSVSARRQIKILNLLEKVKDIDLNLDLQSENFIAMLLSLANNEPILNMLGECFDVAYPTLVEQVTEKAQVAGEECADALDLFPIEEIVSAIAPLFIRLAKKTMGAFQKVAQG